MTNEIAEQDSQNSSVQLSLKRRRLFLKLLAETGGKVLTACKAVGYSDSSFVRRLRREDPDFAAEWDKAIEAAGDVLEEEANRRAMEGVVKPDYYQGRICGYTTVYSDTMLMFLLRGARPDKFRDNVRVEGELKGNFGVALLPATMENVENWEKNAKIVHAGQTLALPPPNLAFNEIKPALEVVRA